MPRDDFDYIAFISYRHEPVGRKWAMWIQHAIENYRVPWSLVRLGKAPRRVGKCFRDEEELAASADLSTTIDSALKASKFLIVICTPRTPHSKWVNEEIKRFRELGRGEQILALLVEGDPREAFPPALREIRPSVDEDQPEGSPIQQIEPLAADIRDDIAASGGHGRGHMRSMAKLRIIAGLLGVSFDDLYNRNSRRVYGRMLATAALGVLIAAMMIGLATYAFAQRAEAVRLRGVAEDQRKIAETQRDSAKAVTDFLVNDILANATPEQIRDARVRDEIVRAMVTPPSQRVSEKFAGKPLVEAEIRDILTVTFQKLSYYQQALPHARAALDIRRRELGNEHPDTIRSIDHYAQILQELGRDGEAEPLYREALETARKLHGMDDPVAITELNNYADAIAAQDRLAEAEPLFKEALDRSRRVLGPDHPDTRNSICQYAGVLLELGRAQEAEDLFRDALARSRRVLGDDHPDTMRIMNYLGESLMRLGRVADAEAIWREALARRLRVLGSQHTDAIISAANYAAALEKLGRFADAERLYNLAVNAARNLPALGPSSEKTHRYAERWVTCLYVLGQNQEAEKISRDFGVTAPQPTSRPAIVAPGDDVISQFVSRVGSEWK